MTTEIVVALIAASTAILGGIATCRSPSGPQVIPNPRLCKALTDQAHIITPGADSYRFRRTTAQRKAGKT
jgi:hypothetical protein